MLRLKMLWRVVRTLWLFFAVAWTILLVTRLWGDAPLGVSPYFAIGCWLAYGLIDVLYLYYYDSQTLPK